jgi:hypothetical protein
VLATQPGIVNDTFGFGVHTRGADGNVAYVIDGIPILTVPLGQYGVGNFVPTRLVQTLKLTTGGSRGVRVRPRRRVLRRATLTATAWGRLVDDQLDRQNVGTTNLVASYNFQRGRAVGGEIAAVVSPIRYLDGFANGGWQIAEGQGFASERYLFTPAELAFTGWGTLDHVQTWTANVGFDLHDEGATSHFSGLVNYGSGLRTGLTDTLHVPSHLTVDLTLRHRFDVPLHPELAFDLLNAFDDMYAIRIATGYVGSAYAPLRRAMVRLIVPFSG